jgi:hypothetical protein
MMSVYVCYLTVYVERPENVAFAAADDDDNDEALFSGEIGAEERNNGTR